MESDIIASEGFISPDIMESEGAIESEATAPDGAMESDIMASEGAIEGVSVAGVFFVSLQAAKPVAVSARAVAAAMSLIFMSVLL
ncbi:hypothetical protein HMPREF3227_01085 [Corynebacterium sp. CMW7794]|nr:hypothetical protein HMPREF3227_01085 [Corynebacterium sp. CMW7794]